MMIMTIWKDDDDDDIDDNDDNGLETVDTEWRTHGRFDV